jgi:hypothetical protein
MHLERTPMVHGLGGSGRQGASFANRRQEINGLKAGSSLALNALVN